MLWIAAAAALTKYTDTDHVASYMITQHHSGDDGRSRDVLPVSNSHALIDAEVICVV